MTLEEFIADAEKSRTLYKLRHETRSGGFRSIPELVVYLSEYKLSIPEPASLLEQLFLDKWCTTKKSAIDNFIIDYCTAIQDREYETARMRKLVSLANALYVNSL